MKSERFYELIRNRLRAVVASVVLAMVVWLAVFSLSVYFSYAAYWNAIYRVQTVDINMVSHVFPSALKDHIINRDYESIQTMISSNYSLFKMAVDVCLDASCTDSKEVAANARKYAGERIDVPIFRYANLPAAVRFEHAYSRVPVGDAANGREQIGRLRLYRGVPPSLTDDLRAFAAKTFSSQNYASRDVSYLSNFFFSLSFAVIVALLLLLVRNYQLEKEMRRGIAELLRTRILKRHGST